jgi:hypothetical protein
MVWFLLGFLFGSSLSGDAEAQTPIGASCGEYSIMSGGVELCPACAIVCWPGESAVCVRGEIEAVEIRPWYLPNRYRCKRPNVCRCDRPLPADLEQQ